MNLIEKIRQHPGNQSFWQRNQFDAVNVKIHPFEKNYTQGHVMFFDTLGRDIPDAAKFFISHCAVMIREETGEIFIFDHGRFTFITKGYKYKQFRKRETLDGLVNIENMDEEWSIMFLDDEDDENAKNVFEIYAKK